MDEVNETNEAIESDNVEQENGINLYLASRWRRLGAAIIDGIISMIVVFVSMHQMGILKRSFEGVKMTINEQLYLFIISWVAFLIINGYLLYKRGQTVGKLMVNTQIVDLKGKIPNFGKILLLRYLVFGLIAQIPLIGGLFNLVDILFIFGRERRCLHDYLAGTVVINESDSEG